MIDKSEGDLLAGASANVLAQFDITPDPKTQAIIGMIIACSAVYAPRVIMIRARKAQEEAEKADGTAGVYGPGGEPMGTTGFSQAPN